MLRAGFSPSVLDRLLTPGRSGSQAAENPDAILRDLEVLLNSRREANLIPSHFVEAAGSILNFGIPDLANFDLENASDRVRLANEIAAAIKRFEPRLDNVRVEAIESKERKALPRLAFRIEARLKSQSVGSRLTLTTELHTDSDRFVVKDGVG